MRERIWEYMTVSEEMNLSESRLLVFDSGFLLNLYCFTGKTKDEVLKMLTDLRDILWMPYGNALRYARRRCDVIYRNRDRYLTVEQEMENWSRKIAEALCMEADDPSLLMLRRMNRKWVEEAAKKNIPVTDVAEDGIFETILNLYEGKTGPGWTDDDLQKLIAEGKKRYEGKIPPGFRSAAECGG